MKIYFEAKGGLTSRVPPGETDLEGSREWTVNELIENLGLPVHEVGNVIVNGRVAGSKARVNEGDKIIFFPVIAGG